MNGRTSRYPFDICKNAKVHVLSETDHMKKLPPRGFSGTMNPQEKKIERR
jgi:hypothetical protein